MSDGGGGARAPGGYAVGVGVVAGSAEIDTTGAGEDVDDGRCVISGVGVGVTVGAGDGVSVEAGVEVAEPLARGEATAEACGTGPCVLAGVGVPPPLEQAVIAASIAAMKTRSVRSFILDEAELCISAADDRLWVSANCGNNV